MQALKARILELLNSSPHAKSPEAEAVQILFHVFRMSNQKIREPADLDIQNPVPGVAQTLAAIALAENRAKGVPLQHLLGYQFFYSHEYLVDSSTLIPRPETEILVDEAIRWISRTKGAMAFRFAELGLGSGIISSEILARFPAASAVASEINPAAILLAARNFRNILEENHTSRIKVLQSPSPTSGFEEFLPHGRFDLILSNPPYLSTNDGIEREVRDFEPAAALFPMKEGEPSDPDYFYKDLSRTAPALLTQDGAIFVEVPHERAERIMELFTNPDFGPVRLIPDLNGRPRVLFGQRKVRH